MKIAYFLDFWNCFGGSNNLLLQHANLMQQAGHKVHVILPCNEQGETLDEYRKRCRIYDLKYECLFFRVAISVRSVDIINVLDVYEKVLDFIKKQDVDFLHSVQLNVAVELAARELNLPHLMSVYQIEENAFRTKYPDIFAHYHSCDSLLYSGIWGGGLGISSRCIRQSTNIAYRERTNADDITIIMVGLLSKHKNQLLGIKAIERLVEKRIQIRLNICGNTNTVYAQECMEYVSEHHLENVVRFEGFVSSIAEQLYMADAFLCVSRDESFPFSIVEAMASGLPIITVPVAGVPEVIRDGNNGYLSKGYTEDDVCDAIQRFIWDRDNKDLHKITRASRQTYEEFGNAEVVTRQLNDYYSFILKDYIDANVRYSIQDLRKDFGQLRTKFHFMKDDFENAERTSKMLWSLWICLSGLIQNNVTEKRFYIWGAGVYGRSLYEAAQVLQRYMISGYVDSIQKGECMGLRILTPQQYLQLDNVIVLIAVYGIDKQEIVEFLESHGKGFKRDYYITI
jgi:glycosyltransferase involved in cell wall biosynthesis